MMTNHVSLALYKANFLIKLVLCLTFRVSPNLNLITLNTDMILTSGFHQFEALEVPKKLVYLAPYEKIWICDRC